MKSMTRRHFMHLSGSVTTAALLSACGGTASSTTKLRWWDHFSPLEPLHKQLFDTFEEKNANVKVEYQLYNLPQLGQSLQLAFNNKQAPDVHAIASLGVPTSKLVASKWFTPLDEYVTADFKKRFPENLLLEGLHIFGGKLHSFPLFSFRSHAALIWFNKQMMADAGADPETGPKTWDEFRQVAQKITKKGQGQYHGWIQSIQLAERLGAQVGEMAQAAGAPTGGMDLKTGEYIYDTDPFVQTVEFLLSLKQDGSLLPASTSLDARNARARFSAGSAGMFLDGSWCVGVVKKDYPDFLEKLGVGQLPVPDAKTTSYLHREPYGGDFWLSSQSKNPELAVQILEQLNTEEYYIKLAERMDQPPLDLSVVEKANVHPTYKQALGYFDDIIKLSPSPIVRNPALSQVQAEMKDIRPNLGEIVQGAISGNTPNYKAALKDYNDKLSAERERAVKAVQDKGEQVSLDDWVFSNWDATKDYTSDMYQK